MGDEYVFRRFGAPGDLAGMSALRNARVLAEGFGEYLTVSAMEQQYSHLQRCDPETDLVVVERAGAVVGYARTTWDDSAEGTRDHWLIVEADARCPGLEEQIIEWCEARATAIAKEMASAGLDRPQNLRAEAIEGSERERQLSKRGFTALRWGQSMIRPHFRDIPERPLPDGLEIRPVIDDHLRAIWEADAEAFRDHWGHVEQTEEDWEIFRGNALATGTSLWKVAWDGDEVVGQVRTYENEGERELFGVRRAWTEHVSTRRAWRGRGVAAAVIAASLRQLGELGYEQAVLGVDSENPNRAFALYESLGYEVVARDAVYHKVV